jgi:hypothetical protein
MATATAAKNLTTPRERAAAGGYDRMFYGAMSVALALTVFGGFAPTYYSRLLNGRPTTISGGPVTPLVHVHAALFTAWVLLFVTQTALVAARRVAVHRRLGVAGGLLAAAMVAVGTAQAVATAKRGGAPVGVDPLVFLAIPVFDMILFGGFVTAALALRRDKEAHKRLMLLAYISIIVAAVARLPGVIPLGPPGFFGLAFSFALLAVAYDLVTRRRVHKAYAWGVPLLLASVPIRLAVSGTAPWRALAQFLTR